MAPRVIAAEALNIDHSAPLGAGASCAVMRATLNGVPVAAKTCATTQSAEEQFSREVRRLHACRHPNIINVYGVVALCENPRRPADLALVTELCEGGSLQSAIERLRRLQRRRISRRRLRSQNDFVIAESSSTLSRDCDDDDIGYECAPESGAEFHPENLDERYAGLPANTLVRIAGGVASALAYLHDAGLSQGDVKPLNILLTRPLSPDGSLQTGSEAKICDFGLSRRFVAPSKDSSAKIPEPSASVDRSTSLSSVRNSTSEARSLRLGKPARDMGMQGTVPYLAPEAFAGIPSDAFGLACAADIYALGICLYELVTLRSAWPDHKPWGVFNAVVLRGERPSWPTEVWAREKYTPWRELVELCWQENPMLRPSARFVLSEIVRIGSYLNTRPAGDCAVLTEAVSNLSVRGEVLSQSSESESSLGDSSDDVQFLDLIVRSDNEAESSGSDHESQQETSSDESSVIGSSRCRLANSGKVASCSDIDQTSSDMVNDTSDELLDGLDARIVTSRSLSIVVNSVNSDGGSTLQPDPGQSHMIKHRGAEGIGSISVFERSSSRNEATPVTATCAETQGPKSKTETLSLQGFISKHSVDSDAQLNAEITHIVENWKAGRPLRKKRQRMS